MKKPKDIDDYISWFPTEIQEALRQMRTVIQRAAPKAEETISYAIPTFKQDGGLVSFAGYAKHIGFYPGAAAIKEFEKELSAFKHSKGSVQFPLGEPLPVKLVTKIVRYRVRQNAARARRR